MYLKISPNVSHLPHDSLKIRDKGKSTRIVVSPEGSDLVLSTNIPDIELHILIGDAFNVETDGRDSGDVLIGELQFVEDC